MDEWSEREVGMDGIVVKGKGGVEGAVLVNEGV